ncbi:uncharacterized protein LOC105390473 isoform X2 [Plutella xylostella]|uniref:uncharacterized protein LOC105390473 isoform X2 n=1 Tax=Plutella xylostella TaxID=51655 RepID=UPI0020328DD1|nr:uncharacterized protein LOC105390473 isoform X2 [Plutella xylostella]
MLPTSVVVTSIKCLLLLTTATVYGQDINYLSTFKDYLNSQVNQPYVYEDALLLNQQDSGDNVIIEVNFKVSEKSNPKSFKLLKCTATIASDQDGGLSLPEGHHCQEDLAVARYNVTDNVDGQDQAEEASTEVIHEILVELDNEVQSDTAVTSGEQFVAVPRQSPEAPCIGCSSIVNTSAAGVTDLARLAVADLNRHVTNATHTLDQVLRVERQVQVNGVRYIMTLAVDYIDTNQESGSKTCKISILEKPWVKRLDGSKYRAVLSNNCTEEWIYDVNNDNNNDEDNIKAIHTVEAQAAPSTERTLTDEELKLLEDQIIPNTQDKLQENVPTTTETQTSATEKVQNVFEVNSSPDLYNKEETGENREPVLTKEKQEVIDGLMNFFDDRDDLVNLEKNLLRRQTLQKRDVANENINSVDKVQSHPKIKFVGAPATVDPSDPKYRVIAEKSLKKYTADTGLGSEYSVLSVERASTQLVAGTLTRVDFTAGARDQPVRCHSVLYERPWENFEQLNVTCDFHNLKKREMPGAPQALNVSDPKYHALAVEALAKYTLDSGDPTPYQVVSVLSGTKQVVAGSSTRLVFAVRAAPAGPATATCEAVVWEQPWRKFKEINVTCNLKNRQKREAPNDQESVEKHQTIVRSHPEINFVGAPATVDASDPKYRVIAEKSLKKYTADTGLGSEYSVLSVEHATTQLVAGTLTTVDFTAGARDQPVRCHSVLYERPWENFEQLNVTCDFHNLKKRGMPGAPEALNVSDPKYHALAVEALGKYTMDSGDTTPYQVVSVLSGTKQVVAGSSTRLVFAVRAAPTGPATATCEAVVWEQPWRKFKEINVTCNLNNRQKRETPNALPADEQILVQEAIERYQQLSNTKYAYRVMKVLNVTRQSPEGLITKMEFEVSPTKCKVTDDIATIRACELRHTHAKLLCLTTVHQNSPTDQKTFDIICEEKQKKHKHPIDNDENVQQLIQEAIDKLESNQLHTNKQRLLQIHKHYTNVTSTKVTTIDFDLAYTSCLKYEIIEDVENCKFIDSIPPRHCVASVYERHWMTNGKYIDVNCDNDEQAVAGETIDSNVTMALANEALKHVEAKYPHPNKQIVVKIISAERQVVAGVHWRLKMEVGLSTCPALTPRANCRRDSDAPTKFCRANIWVQPSGDHPPIYRVSCEDQDEATTEMYEKLQAQKLFADFVGTYRPTYALDRIELGRRFEIFRENVKKMHELNTHERGTATYGVTRFADLTREEFTKRHLGLKPELKDHNQIPRAMASIPQVELPAGFDWREKGAVTEVKNQGACGSCWAFSVTGNVEGQYQLKTGKLLSLSEQELVDCDKLDNGCNGGLPDNAYRAIEQLGGLEVESDYPYDGADDKCSFNKTLSRVQISGAVNISSDETDMAKWLVQHGPISIGINANAMQFYVGGVSHPWKMLCNPKNIDHGVLIVGYGVKQYPLFKRTMPYWIVKNSWGPLWGEQGYYRVYRGDGTCGVNQMASSALI